MSAPAHIAPSTRERRLPTDEEIADLALRSGIVDCLLDPWDQGVGDGDESRSVKADCARLVRLAIQRFRLVPGAAR